MHRLTKDSRTHVLVAAYRVHATRLATLITRLRSSCVVDGNPTTHVSGI